MIDRIRVRGARQHNLKGVDVDIQRGRLTVLTGPSGSGKSSLAFDTIYAEGQRRYIESLSTYAKQFLERMPKPAVDLVEGVSPSVSIDQRNAIQSSRSTVGTVTEVYDHLRLLWSRVGTTVCPDCEEPVVPDTVQSATDRVLASSAGSRAIVAFPLKLSSEITHAMAVSNLRSQGYVRVLADGTEVYLPDLPEDVENAEPAPETDLTRADDLLVVVDRLVADESSRERLADSLAAAFAEGHGTAVVLEFADGIEETGRQSFNESFRCSTCGRGFSEPFPNLFSFNSPAGACETCTGFGAVLEYAMELMVPDPTRSLLEGALDPWTKPRYKRERADVLEFAEAARLDVTAPWETLPEEARDVLINGGRFGGARFTGLIPFMKSREPKRYKAYIRVFLRQYQLPRLCGTCAGTRLKPDALHVRVGGRHIAEVAALGVERMREWLSGDLGLTPFLRKVAGTVLEEISDRVAFLDDVGLGYLTLDRQARSLSGGEMQRIRLASCLGSRLVDTLYVLDEPTIGLHPHDTDRFVAVIDRLAAAGNTVLVVEHETAVIEHADDIIELGPGAGEAGGEVVFQGDWGALLKADTSTGRALAGARPSKAAGRRGGRRGSRRPGDDGWLEIRGARLHNLAGVDARFPLGALTVVTGVSGSGKSSLVRGVLFHAVERALEGESSARTHLGDPEGACEALEGVGALDGVSLVDQQPIGRTPRSNPATYIGAFKEIRAVFAELPESRRRGYTPGYFSFNRAGGRCERCKGAGYEVVEMVFLADVAVPCEACGGSRYRPEVLEVDYRGYTINDVLDLTVDQAIRFFIRQDRLGEALWNLQRVGLGYLRLGQPATTLSGGEAQRLKIARELARRTRRTKGRRKGGRRLYLLDEPTVGLGVGEVATLVSVLRQLVDDGHAVLVVEHNLDVIAAADWVVDMGPGAAAEGGRIVAQGPPAEVAASPESLTGQHLAKHARRSEAAARARA
jgi:excinuclease ABC subunit A